MPDKNKFYAKDPSENDAVNNIFLQAIDQHVSDIHFEPTPEFLNIRFRIDGILQLVYRFNKEQQETILSRLKVLADLDITEHRHPQDGYIEYVCRDRTYVVRVSSMPTIYGEAIVCRVHNREDILKNLNELGLEDDQLNTIKSMVSNFSGIILATGPTGSGKTSLLYSILHTLNKTDKNIITIEDPIEYHLPNIRQTQVNDSIELSFSKVMRSVVRQDPDIVLLGEIRDEDTAQMAAQASLIGTLIFSTFHTFDIPALITRLQEMGLTHSVIAQSIKGIISTRLVRKICTSCKTLYTASDEEKRLLGKQDEETVTLYKGSGCDNCRKLGYSGRIGVYEIVSFDDELKAHIIEQKPATLINEYIRDKNIKTLQQGAVDRVLDGVTTIDEIIRVLGLRAFN